MIDLGVRTRAIGQLGRERHKGRGMDWTSGGDLGLERGFPEEISQFLTWGSCGIQVNLVGTVKVLVKSPVSL